MAYENRCYDLAAVFLSHEPELDTETRRQELAQLIQTTIENRIAFERGQGQIEHLIKAVNLAHEQPR